MKLGALLLCAVVASSAAIAQPYPSRPIRWVAPSASGSTSDIVARLVAEKLGAAVGVTVAVDNRPGAGGNISAEIVVKSRPDGYTVLTGITALAVNPSLYSKLSYNPLTDLAPNHVDVLCTARSCRPSVDSCEEHQ